MRRARWGLMETKIDKWGKWKIAWLSTSNQKEIATLMESGAVDGVGINQHNQKGATTALLKKLPSPRGLVLTDVEGMDLFPISQMLKLRFLTLGQERKTWIDFSKYSELEDLRINYHLNDVFPTARSKLSDLCIASYKPVTKALSEVESFPHLTTLELVQPNIQKLDGIEKQKALRKIELHYCRSLTSLSALANTEVEMLHLSSCSKIEDFAALAGCPELKIIIVSSCGTIPSLRFLNDCKKLEEFRCVNTVIGDNDLLPMLRLKSVAISNRRSYSHTNEELNKLVEARRASVGF
jgi:hypothetical protein